MLLNWAQISSFGKGLKLLYFVDCEDLIRQMLTVDAEKRITIEQIIKHRWIRNNEADPEFEQLIEEYNTGQDGNQDSENMNDNIIQQMQSIHGLDREKTVEVCCCVTMSSPVFFHSNEVVWEWVYF